MIRVTGKATIELRYAVELDLDDISTNIMSISESDKLIADAILKKYNQAPKTLSYTGLKKQTKRYK